MKSAVEWFKRWSLPYSKKQNCYALTLLAGYLSVLTGWTIVNPESLHLGFLAGLPLLGLLLIGLARASHTVQSIAISVVYSVVWLTVAQLLEGSPYIYFHAFLILSIISVYRRLVVLLPLLLVIGGHEVFHVVAGNQDVFTSLMNVAFVCFFIGLMFSRWRAITQTEKKYKRVSKALSTTSDLAFLGTLRATAVENEREFIALMVHKLKTPAAVVHSYCDLLEQKWAQINEAGRLNLISKISASASEIIQSIDSDLELLDSESRGWKTECIWIPNVGECVRGIVEKLKVAYPNLEALIVEQDEMGARVDQRVLSIILGHLVDNGFTHGSNSHPISVIVRRKNDRFIDVSVISWGSITKKPLANHVFSKEYKGQDKNSGTGLGLWIASNYAHSMMSELSVSQYDEEGSLRRTVFSLCIPAAREVCPTPRLMDEAPLVERKAQ